MAGKVAPTWSGEYWKGGGGGTAWDAIVYDQELDQLYIGVGNGSPWNHEIRSDGKGDNLFLSSIVALDGISTPPNGIAAQPEMPSATQIDSKKTRLEWPLITLGSTSVFIGR